MPRCARRSARAVAIADEQGSETFRRRAAADLATLDGLSNT